MHIKTKVALQYNAKERMILLTCSIPLIAVGRLNVTEHGLLKPISLVFVRFYLALFT